MDRAADDRYPTMTTVRICALVPPAEGCRPVFMANPSDGERCVRRHASAGFTYKAETVWEKLDFVGNAYRS